jgi:hypothetical protein
MERATLGHIKRLLMTAAAAALAGCTGTGGSESVPDSAALTVAGEPAAAPQPAQAESVTSAPGRTSGASPTPPARRTPAQSEPVLIQPPPPRDTRPSIPWPPDTL